MDNNHNHHEKNHSSNEKVEDPNHQDNQSEHQDMDHSKHAGHGEHDEHSDHADHSKHAGHGEHDEHADHTDHENMFRTRFWISLLIGIPVLLYSEVVQGWLNFSMPEFAGSEWVVPVFSIIIFLYGGVPFIKMAVPEFRSKQPGMMALISLAIGVSFTYSLATTLFKIGESFYWELVTLIIIMLLGHWLEMRSVRQASGALDELAKLLPDTAERINHDGSTEVVLINALSEKDIVLVRPGASIPTDGIIEQGQSDVNEAMISGESIPVRKKPGMQVIAGTINGEGSLRVSVSATGEDTALAGIMRLVEEAQKSKSNTQLLADKAAGWLFYGAILVALLTGILWSIAVGADIEVLKRVVTVLVIACPHALGLAIPLVVAISTSVGAKNGILVRDRLALEAARNLDVIIFDKTGTLTEGKFGVVGIQTANNWEENNALALTAALESDSEHLIARSIRGEADSRNLAYPEVKNFEAIKGLGIQADVNGNQAYVGGPKLLSRLKIQPPEILSSFALESGKKGRSVVYLIQNQDAVAAFALADVIRKESKEVIEQLNAYGIETVMLTGDSKEVARAVAEELGIARYFGEVLPEDKDKKVIELQAEGKSVAMVGDGVNDAPALTRADVGIAIGSGTDVAVQSAGLILVKSNPMDVVNIVTLSKATYRKMIQNLVWATGYNIIALPLAAGVLAPWGILLSPAVGALFMSLSTVVVALNAQLLRNTFN